MQRLRTERLRKSASRPARASSPRTSPPRSARLWAVAAAAALAVLLPPRVAEAHSLAPSLLVIRELAAGRAEIQWKTPVLRVTGADPRPALPSDCVPEGARAVEADYESETTTWIVRCGEPSFVGRTVGVNGLAAAKTDALLRVQLADGRSVDTVLRADDASFVVPARENRLWLVTRYVRLGFDHILSGYDHLVFVLGLLLLVNGTRALVATVSAFTLGHSITLALAVLDVARMPPAPVEVLIAFSIYILATELARPAGASTLMRRRPWVMAAGFGLLHGLGFAGSLRAAGLPSDGIPLALLSFNVGIEVGQLVFVLAIVAVGAVLRVLALSPPAWARVAVVYAMGSVAALWIIERAVPLLAAPALAGALASG